MPDVGFGCFFFHGKVTRMMMLLFIYIFFPRNAKICGEEKINCKQMVRKKVVNRGTYKRAHETAEGP